MAAHEIPQLTLGIPVYDGVDLLDVTGPFEMFSWVDKSKCLQPMILSADGQAVTSGNGVRFHPHASFKATPQLDILWVPGGTPEALTGIMSNPDSEYLEYLRQIAAGAKWVCSVCEGALLLARAGLLDGHAATTHWAFVGCLQRFEKITVDTTHQRFVQSGNRLTGGGISSGLDEALELLLLLFDQQTAEAVQIITQYRPQPPVSAQIPDTPKCMVHW